MQSSQPPPSGNKEGIASINQQKGDEGGGPSSSTGDMSLNTSRKSVDTDPNPRVRPGCQECQQLNAYVENVKNAWRNHLKKQHEEQANKYKATIEEIKKNKAKVENEKNAIKKELHKKETQIQSLQAELQKQANASAANEVLEDNLKRAMALIDENREYRTQAEDLMASLFKEYTAYKNKPTAEKTNQTEETMLLEKGTQSDDVTITRISQRIQEIQQKMDQIDEALNVVTSNQQLVEKGMKTNSRETISPPSLKEGEIAGKDSIGDHAEIVQKPNDAEAPQQHSSSDDDIEVVHENVRKRPNTPSPRKIQDSTSRKRARLSISGVSESGKENENEIDQAAAADEEGTNNIDELCLENEVRAFNYCLDESVNPSTPAELVSRFMDYTTTISDNLKPKLKERLLKIANEWFDKKKD